MELKDLNGKNGTWESSNSKICSVDDNGIITWNSVGKATVSYITQDRQKEVFNITCKYAIAKVTDGWSSLNNVGKNGTSTDKGNSNVGVDVYNANGYNAIVASASSNQGIWSVIIYRTVDLTNVNKITFTEFYSNDSASTSTNGYEFGLIRNDPSNSTSIIDCLFDECYTHYDVSNNTIAGSPMEYDVQNLSGEYIIAFKATHSNVLWYTNCAGYQSDILFEP